MELIKKLVKGIMRKFGVGAASLRGRGEGGVTVQVESALPLASGSQGLKIKISGSPLHGLPSEKRATAAVASLKGAASVASAGGLGGRTAGFASPARFAGSGNYAFYVLHNIARYLDLAGAPGQARNGIQISYREDPANKMSAGQILEGLTSGKTAGRGIVMSGRVIAREGMKVRSARRGSRGAKGK